MHIRAATVLVLGVLCTARPAAAQELGNKVLGGIGVDAGVQPEPGLYLLDRLVDYRAGQLRDRNGDVLPVASLDIDALCNVLGIAFTTRLAKKKPYYYSLALGAPLAHVTVSADDPRIDADASGFGDFFLQPLKLGARFDHGNVVASYTFYAPTGHFEPRRLSVGRGFWTHQLSLGGAFRGDRTRRQRFSFLASYDINGRKRDIDITRGNIVQLQGGAGAQLAGPLDLGLAGFAMWQLTDNHGSDLPTVVRGARSRVFGLGPELNLTIPSLRARLDARTEWEFGARSRQEGWVLVTAVSVMVHGPAGQPKAARPAATQAGGEGGGGSSRVP